MISAGTKRLVKQTETTRYRSKASDHKNSTGKYHIHLYYIQNDGSRVGVGTTTTEVEFEMPRPRRKAAIKNVNATNGTYTVAVDQAPQGPSD